MDPQKKSFQEEQMWRIHDLRDEMMGLSDELLRLLFRTLLLEDVLRILKMYTYIRTYVYKYQQIIEILV